MDVQLVDTIFSDEENDLCYIIIFLHSLRVKLRMRGVSRREIGHGHLAERAHKNLIPVIWNFLIQLELYQKY